MKLHHVKKFRRAGWFWTTVFNWSGFAGVTLPWPGGGRVYLHPDYWNCLWLWRHEHAHLEQIERDGMWLWWVRIWWYIAIYGYHDSPYEVEARAAEELSDVETVEGT